MVMHGLNDCQFSLAFRQYYTIEWISTNLLNYAFKLNGVFALCFCLCSIGAVFEGSDRALIFHLISLFSLFDEYLELVNHILMIWSASGILDSCSSWSSTTLCFPHTLLLFLFNFSNSLKIPTEALESICIYFVEFRMKTKISLKIWYYYY